MTTTEHVEFLVGASQFAINIEDNGVIPDEERVDELREMDGFSLFLTTGEHLALFHLLLGEVACKLDHELRCQFFEPFVVISHRDFGEIQNLRCLLFVGMEVFLDLLVCQRLSQFIAPRGIANHRGEASYYEDDLVSGIHELLEFPQRYGVTEV